MRHGRKRKRKKLRVVQKIVGCPEDCVLCKEPRITLSYYSKCEKCGKEYDESPICICGLAYIAHNICNKCGLVWHGPPGPNTPYCPNPKGCDSLYWTWANYKEDRPNWCSICKTSFGIA